MRKQSMQLLHSSIKSKAPIEDTVEANWPDIVLAASNGHSRAAIAEALKQAGYHVGGTSGFNRALAQVSKRKGVVFDDLSKAASPPAMEEAPEVSQGASTGAELDTPMDAPGNHQATAAAKGHGGGQSRPTADDNGQQSATHTDGEGSATTVSPFADDRFPSDF